MVEECSSGKAITFFNFEIVFNKIKFGKIWSVVCRGKLKNIVVWL